MWVVLLLVVSVGATSPRRPPPATCNQPKPQCPPNEYYELCPKTCPREGCDRLWTKFKCDPKEKCGTPTCKCNEGLYRKNGKCVKAAECQPSKPPMQVCPLNEHYDLCPKSCPSEGCDRLWSRIKCDENEPCGTPTCRCDEAFYRKDGQCVPYAECVQTTAPSVGPVTGPCKPPMQVCPPNEYFESCPKTCPSEGCDQLWSKIKCDENEPCGTPTCRCAAGFFRKNGICINGAECMGRLPCGYNEKYVPCRTICPPQNCDLPYTFYLCAQYIRCEPGCDCIEGHWRNASKICIPKETCPPLQVDVPPTEEPVTEKPKCGVNETEVPCKQLCPPQSCNIAYTDYFCDEIQPCIAGCDCKENYLRNDDGICILNDECSYPQGEPETTTSPPDIVCGYNEELVPRVRGCPPQVCEALYLSYLCAFIEPESDDSNDPGCMCIGDYLRNSSGICVPPEQCPPPPWITQPPVPICGLNETYVDCKQQCPPQSCDISYTTYMCTEESQVCQPGCNCKDDYLRTPDGDCVFNNDCPLPPFNQPTVYPPTDTTTTTTPSPTVCSINETAAMCQQFCPPQSCDGRFTEHDCAIPIACIPGCNCINNYYRNSSGICVKEDECPPAPNNTTTTTTTTTSTPAPTPACGMNETQAMCKRLCPPQSCDALYAIHECNIPLPCIPGCNCIDKYYRNPDGICVKADECPPPPWQRTTTTTTPPPPTTSPPVTGCWTSTSSRQSHSTSSSSSSSASSSSSYSSTKTPSSSQDTYSSQATSSAQAQSSSSSSSDFSSSVSNKPCPPPTDVCKENEVFVRCKVSCPTDYCATNDARVFPICDPAYPCPSGCVCKVGYKRKSREDPRCIPSETCPAVECTRPNEKWNSCPSPCLGETCSDSTSPPATCNTLIKDCRPQCVCQKGYYRNDSDICIPAADCFKTKCSANETFAQCQFDCPTIFCPTNDDLGIIACSPPYPCPSGCTCKSNYRRKSREDRACILAEDCAPVTCTRPNEVWSSCPSSCLAENCRDAGKPDTPCFEKMRYCRPRCVCQKGHYRNDSNICVPAKDCIPTTTELPTTTTTTAAITTTDQPECGANQTIFPCTFKCPNQFCPDSDDRTKYACKPPRDCPSGCGCLPGYKYKSNEELECVLAQDCPAVECTRANEVWAPCSSGCLAESCDASENPPAGCDDPDCYPTCVCQEGYFRNKDDVCVPKSECNQCKPNERYVQCKVGCPTDYCPTSDSRGMIACDPPYPCPGGCICELNYKMKSYEDPTCILATDCPPVNCTRPNEEWAPCPSGCLAEDCQDADKPASVCNELLLNCQPKCVCKEGYFRNESDICVPKLECQTCPPNSTYVSCKGGCPTDYCPSSDSRAIVACSPPHPDYCRGGCICDRNYKRKSYEDPSCVLASECPPQTCTRPNEEWSTCPSNCLSEYCSDADRPPSDCSESYQSCQPKCVCKEGYFRNESDICVPKAECQQCPPNSTYSSCKWGCPTNYCPSSDSRAIVDCASPPLEYCSGGCVCESNYKIKSYDDPTCVLASDCPPQECTRQNEEWDSCPSSCLTENCGDINNPPSVCNELWQNCQPKCVCREGYFRNDSDICVSKAECQQCKANEVYLQCTRDCPTDYCPTSDSRAYIACDPPYPCPGGCICDLYYTRKSYEDPTCILASTCPPINCSRPNEVWSSCPSPCLIETCAESVCPKIACEYRPQTCQPRCVCEEGYFRDENDVCVPQDKCPPPQIDQNPPTEPPPEETTTSLPSVVCGPNSSPADCDSKCANNYCPTNDRRGVVPCAQPFPCPAGCMCNLNYRKLSYRNETCVLAASCPKIKCTSRPNERWNTCPSPCLRESCDDIYDQPTTCNYLVENCQPQCICKKDHFRNSSGICIPVYKCPGFKTPVTLFYNV